jgi:hypothetical protein
VIQEVQEIARQTLAACAAFQSLVGAANANIALDYIYHDAWPPPASGPTHTLAEITELRPSAIVYTDPIDGFDMERDASADICWHNSGTIHLLLFRNTPEAALEDPSLADTGWREIVGNILVNLRDLSETPGMLASRAFRVAGMYRTEPTMLEAEGDAQAADIVIRWGVRT